MRNSIFLSFSVFQDKMHPSTKLDDKLEGIEKFCTWKYTIGFILEEMYLEKFIKKVVPEPEQD